MDGSGESQGNSTYYGHDGSDQHSAAYIRTSTSREDLTAYYTCDCRFSGRVNQGQFGIHLSAHAAHPSVLNLLSTDSSKIRNLLKDANGPLRQKDELSGDDGTVSSPPPERVPRCHVASPPARRESVGPR